MYYSIVRESCGDATMTIQMIQQEFAPLAPEFFLDFYHVDIVKQLFPGFLDGEDASSSSEEQPAPVPAKKAGAKKAGGGKKAGGAAKKAGGAQ
jgi:hypothetical protein